jgi:hypothetical protein
LSEPKTISAVRLGRLGHPAGRLGVRAPAAAGGLLLPAAALLSALSRLLAALVLTTLAALTALVLILISHFRFTPNTR